MATKYPKNYSLYIEIRKIQMKTILRILFVEFRIERSTKQPKPNTWGGEGEKEPSSTG